MSRRSLLLLASTVVTAALLPAQQAQPLTAVALFKVKPDKASAWINGVKSVYIPVLQKAMAEGTVQAYGLDADILHRAGEPNMTAWFTVADYAALEKVENAIDEAATKNPTVVQQLLEASDPDKHQDLLVRSIISNLKPVPAGKLPFTRVSVFQVKPGKGEDFRKLFEAYGKATYDKLVADGVISGYSLDVEAEHSMNPNTYWVVVSMPSLSAADKIREAFQAEFKKRPEGEQTAADRFWEEIMVEGTHRDYLTRAVVFATK